MPERILVVDDEEPIREIVASMLTTAGYACTQAASGMEALALLDEHFDLIVSDLLMADLDGIGLLEHTRDNIRDMPVIVVAAIHEIPFALTAIRNGAHDY
jgi:DNA-binding NtrC family response regulator